MACRWMHDPEIGRWWYPECIGGIYGKEGCTCPRGQKAKDDRINQLERRVEKLEKRLDAITTGYRKDE
jgi:hypothetical protein